MSDTELKENIVSTGGHIHDLVIFLLSALVVIFELPYLSGVVPNWVELLLMGLILLMSLPFILRMSRTRQMAVIGFVVYFAVIVAYSVAHISSVSVESHYSVLRFFFFGVVILAIQDSISLRQKRYLIAVIIISVLYNFVSNIILYVRYGASMYVHIFQNESFETNAVNTQFTTSLLFFSGALFVYYLHRCRFRFLALLLSLSSILFAVGIAQRAMIAVFAVIMYSLLLLYNSERERSRIVVGVLAVVAVVVILINLQSILQIMHDAVRSERLQNRIDQMYRFLASGDINEAGGSLTARVKLIQTSFKTFTSSFRHIMFGAGAHTANNVIIGNHSYLMDELARYGIVFGSLSFVVFFGFLNLGMKKQAHLQKGTVLNQQMIVLILICVLRAAVGRVNEVSIGIQFFLFVPFVFQIIDNSHRRYAVTSMKSE